ncbi:MAG: TRAP transporter small permease [Pseudomonadota bacterium]
MANASSVLEDGTLLSRLDRALFRVESGLILLGGLAVFSLMLLAVVSVGGRNFANQPLPGYVDWIEQAMPLIAFVGVAYTQRVGGHIRMDMLVGQLRGRALWSAELATVFAMLGLMMLLTWGSWAHFMRAFSFDAPLWSNDSSMDIGLPLWPAKLLAPVSFGVLSLRLALQVWAYARALLSGSAAPVAVPLIEDVKTVAANEAATVSSLKE